MGRGGGAVNGHGVACYYAAHRVRSLWRGEGEMPAKIRVGLLGAGNIGRFHANTVAFKTPGAELVAISDVMGDAAAALAAATDTPRWGANPAVVLDDPAIDAVVIATPGPTHAELITRAAEAGKQIFCEKPIALELAEIDTALA